MLPACGRQVAQVDAVRGIARRADFNRPPPRGGAGDYIEVDGGGQHAAVLVIGVISADFSAARRGEQAHVRFAERPLKCNKVLYIARSRRDGVRIQHCKNAVQFPGRDILYEIRNLH